MGSAASGHQGAQRVSEIAPLNKDYHAKIGIDPGLKLVATDGTGNMKRRSTKFIFTTPRPPSRVEHKDSTLQECEDLSLRHERQHIHPQGST